MDEKDKMNANIILCEDERKILDKLKKIFNLKTRNGVLRHLIQISKEKYL